MSLYHKKTKNVLATVMMWVPLVVVGYLVVDHFAVQNTAETTLQTEGTLTSQ